MRTKKEILQGMTVFYSKKENGTFRIYMIQDNYSHSLETIMDSLAYASTELGLSAPKLQDVNIEILKGDRYNRMMSIEFDSATPPTKQGFELTENSGLWSSLKY